MSSNRSQSQFWAGTPISSLCLVFKFHFCLCLRQALHLLEVNSHTGNNVSTGGTHQWRIFRSSYIKLAWLGFEPTTTEFRSDALTDWAFKPWVQLALRGNSLQLLQIYLFVLRSRFTLVFSFVRCHNCLKPSLALIITLIVQWIDTYVIHYWRISRNKYTKLAWAGFEPTKRWIWKIGIWILFRQSYWLSYQAIISTRSRQQLCAATPSLSLCSAFTFHFDLCLRQTPHLL